MKGSVRPLPNRGPDVYQARWYVGRDDTGKRIERTRTIRAGSLKEAEDLAVPIFAELRAQAEEEAKARGTVAWYADRWLDGKRRELSPTTIDRSYAPIVARIKAEFGRMKLDAVRPSHVKAWYAKLADTQTGEGDRRRPLSAKAIERHHQVLRAMYRDALEEEEVERIPTNVKRPKPRKAKLTIPPRVAVASLLDGVSGDFGNMVRLVTETGLRRGELCGLLWSDIAPFEHAELVDGEPVKVTGLVISVERAVIELKGGGWKVKPTKTDEPREVLVVGDGAQALNDQLASLTEQMGGDTVRALGGFVFPNIRVDTSGRTPRLPGWVTQHWRAEREKYGLSGVRLHDLRHFHASHLIESGVSIKAVQERLGHSTPVTTMSIYTHVSPQGALEAAKAAGVRTPAV